MAPRNSVPARVGSPHSDSYEHRDAFSCEVNGDGDHVVVRLCGELDMAAVPTLMEQVGPLSALFSEVVVDLGGLEFCDSSGLHALVELHRQAHEHGSQFVLRSMTPPVKRVFELTSTTELLQADAHP